MNTQKSITIEAPAKINLSLDITGIREDGYHLVQMLMQTVSCYDTVTVTEREDKQFTMDCNIDRLPTDESNLCIKAAKAICEAYSLPHGYHISLTKRIPMAAGLAGGSTDAAAVLKGIAKLSGISATVEDLQEIALPLGADIPYCVVGGLMLSEGIGEVLTALKALPKRYILLVKPNVDVSTGTVYKAYDSLPGSEIHHPDTKTLLTAIEAQDWNALYGATANVLEQVTAPLVPEISEIEKALMEHGADFSMMSGSGPTVYGVFEEKESMAKACDGLVKKFPAYEIHETETV